MAEMTPRKRALLCVTGNKKRADRISCMDTLTTATVEQMNAVNAPFPEANRDPQLAFKLAAAAWEVIGLEGFKLPFDLCVEAEAFGCKINWGRIDRHPSVETHAFNDLKDLKIPENIVETGRFPLKHKVEEMLRREYGDYLPVINQVTGPFTVAGHIFGIEKFCIWTKKRPLEEVKEALMHISEMNIDDCKKALQSGADVVCIADPSATSDILSPQFFRDVMVPVYQNMARKIGAPVVLHICGNTSAYLPYIADTGFDAFSIDAQVDPAFAKAVVGDKIAIVGGVPTITALLFGTPQKVREAAIDAIRKGVDVLMPSCGIPPRTPTANFKAMVEVARCMVYV
ncbi:MAG: MtaA/CmuA family methyltransferase [Candidatus Verstraetearchaeota archaeon]|nr:MtaA/CmuA family methyltransferase [Candidatus Verstraetearchaeota archaeon]